MLSNSQVGSSTYPAVGQPRPVTITTTAGALTAYAYGPDGSRLKKSANTGAGGATETTLSLGADLERAPDGTWQKYPHPDVRLKGTGASVQTAFLHRDHLSSVRAVSTGGTVVQSTGYRAYGARGLQTGTDNEAHGKIINGGVNKTPRDYNPNTGLSSPDRPGWK